jgi:hypothetical protein
MMSKGDDIPIIKQEDCPRLLIEYLDKKQGKFEKKLMEKLDEKLDPVATFAKTAIDNRLYIQMLAIGKVAILILMILMLTSC